MAGKTKKPIIIISYEDYFNGSNGRMVFEYVPLATAENIHRRTSLLLGKPKLRIWEAVELDAHTIIDKAHKLSVQDRIEKLEKELAELRKQV